MLFCAPNPCYFAHLTHAILRTLPMLFCAPCPCYFAHLAHAILRTLPMLFCAPCPCYFAHLAHAILRTLPMLFCAPFLFYITLLFTHVMNHDALKPIKLFDYTIQLTFFLHKHTYSCYKIQIPKLQTIDTKLTKYWYKTYLLLIQNLWTTNPFC